MIDKRIVMYLQPSERTVYICRKKVEPTQGALYVTYDRYLLQAAHSHRIPSLKEVGIDMAAIRPPAATTRRVAPGLANAAERLTVAVDEGVGSAVAAGDAVVADEGALVVVGLASGADLGDEFVAAHVDLAGNINGGVRARGELSPGVVDLSDPGDASGLVVEAGPSTADTVGEGDGDTVALRKRVGQDCLCARDEGRGIAGALVPEDKDNVRVGAVESECIGSVIADPDLAVIADGIDSLARKSNLREILAIRGTEPGDWRRAIEAAGFNTGGSRNSRGKDSQAQDSGKFCQHDF